MSRALSLLLTLALSLPASALAASGDPGLRAIDADQAAGRLGEADAAMERFYRLLRPEDGDPRYALGPVVEGPSCVAPLLARLYSLRDELTPTQRHHLAQTTDPWYRRWLNEGGISWEDGDVLGRQAAQRATCFQPRDVDRDLGPYDHQTLSEQEHFLVHWDEREYVDQTRIDYLLGWFEESYRVQVEEQGYYGPRRITQNQMLIIVEDLGNDSVGGYTGLAECGFGDTMAYVVINSRWFESIPSLKSTAPHELFHSIQQVYGFEEFWSRGSPNLWFLEASAVYEESIVYPDNRQPGVSQAIRWASEPWRSMLTHDQSGFQYGTWLFPLSIETTLEDDGAWHHAFWTQLFQRRGYDLVDEFDAFLQERGSSFRDEYGRFLSRAATMDFPKNRDLIPPLELEERSQGYYDGVIAEHDDRDYPLQEDVGSASGLPRPEYLGTNFVWFDSDDIDDDIGLVVEFEGNAQKDGDPIEWIVELVGVNDDEPRITHRLALTPVESDGIRTEWRGSILVNDFGENLDGVMLAASPVTRFGEEGDVVSWSYGAWLTDSTGDVGFAPVPDLEEEPVDGDACAGCGSSVGGGTASLLALLLPLGLRRRR